ncbi:MAG: TatD family deoxyribonuclease [Ruminococcaceae bacterium]|nr:TatD family deoxyribonuclease [Oscillospiraceae bacterium]
MRYFDSHSHYNDERFEEEYPGGMAQAITDAHAIGVEAILNAGTNPESSAASVALAEKYPFFYASAGIHPSDSMRIADADIPAALDAVRRIAAHEKCVAIGEIGLDYHWDPDGKARQSALFDAQLSMAEELHLPVIIHDRDAHGDCFDIVRAHPNVLGVFHSFSGSAEMARQLVQMGWYISFSGPITYKNAHKVREAAAVVPHDRILTETDAPYLPPVPHRGELNYSGYLPFTLHAIAEATGMSDEEAAQRTWENACRLFRLN